MPVRLIYERMNIASSIRPLNLAMDSMIGAAKQSEEDFDRFHGPMNRSDWDGCVASRFFFVIEDTPYS